MADVDKPPFTAAKKSGTKDGSKRTCFSGWFKSKRPKLANAPARQPYLNSVALSPSQGGSDTLHQDHTARFRSPRPSLSVPDLRVSTVDEGNAQSLHTREIDLGHEERGSETSRALTLPPQPASANFSRQVPDRKPTEKEVLGVGSRFAQMLLKKLPECADTDPVKMAFSIAKVIIEIKEVVGDNKDDLAQRLGGTANGLLAVERVVVSGVPEAAEQAMEKLEQILGEEMKKLENLANKSLATQTFDYEECKKMIQRIFQRVTEATTSFHVEMEIGIRNTASQIHDDIKKPPLESLPPSEKADDEIFLEEQALKREECTAGTRVKILEDITKWANDSSLASPRVFWLTGQAGSGKTTIAYTITKLFEKGDNSDRQTILGGSFLCSRQSEETRDQSRIVPAIASQLAHKCKSYADALHVAENIDTVSAQLKGLLVGPWQQSEAARSPEPPPYLIVIDALDEIKDEGGSALLRDLLTAINEYGLGGFKFLVTSRPDPKVVVLFESFVSKVDCWLQHVPVEEALLDIGTYLEAKLPKLASNPQLAKLGQRTGGLFIYAATAVKHLTPHRLITAREQAEILNDLLSNPYESNSASNAPFLIDELYRQIMRDTFSGYRGNDLTRRLRVLYTFLCTAERTSASVVTALVGERDDNITGAVVGDLHAVLYIQGDRVFWYHASFPDFLFNPARSNFHLGGVDFVFWCDEPAHHNLLSEACFRVLESGLRFNMGDITSSFLFDSHNTDVLSKKVNNNINAALRYSTRHWTHHLPPHQLTNTDNLRHCISDFLQIRVLFWIEAMNLLGLCNQCPPMLQRACQWALKRGDSYLELARDIGEAANFATYFAGSPAAKSTPHLYISALATWPRNTSLCRNWKNQFGRIPIFAHTKGSIDLPLMTVSARSEIQAVAFSSDGTQILSGSNDWSVRVWDASTGAELNVMKGHTNLVTSVMFSSDGTRIVSGSDDHSVRVWDALKGAELNVLKGHTKRVTSVAFSSDSTRIVSGSHDQSVRVWDASTGAELNVLKGHTGPVNSVAFSSDGTQIVSGSDDKSVRVWDASKGEEIKVLKGHTNWVTSVAFSSNGTRIVSGSRDLSLRVWDGLKGVELNVLNGHTDWVTSVAFSSDSTQIVSGSCDRSVRVWDALKGMELNVLKGHTRQVTSAAFSSDGMRIVSGSLDQSVRLWEASMCVEPNLLKSHTNSVTSVAFSSDGTQIVSGLDDWSVRVWDTLEGGQLKVLKGHNNCVTSVAFSSDGTRIVSGSDDWSLRVWDGLKGARLNVLKGHTDSVTSVAFGRDGTRIVSGSLDQSLRVWDGLKCVELNVLKGHTARVTSVAFSGDGTRIVSGSYDKSVRLWDASTGAELNVLMGHTDWVTSVAFSSDGTRIVSGSHDRCVRLWDASTGAELIVLGGHTNFVTSVAFSNDGTQIVSGSYDQFLRVWDVSTGAELKVLRGHTGWVSSVAFSSDGMRIVSGSDDQSVRVWDMSKDRGHFVWNLTEENWIVSSQGKDHLMWVPPAAQVKEPSNILIISHHGFGSVDFTRSMIGTEWVGCYTP